MQKKKVIVCGASGFTGYNIFNALSSRDDLRVRGTYLTNRYRRINPEDSRLLKANLTDRKQVNRVVKGMDVVIVTSAVSTGAKDVVERPHIHITENVIMNSLIFECCYNNNVKQVIFPSCTVMYPSQEEPSKEVELDLNVDFYPKYFGGAWMKVFTEKLGEFYSRLGRTQYTILRQSNVYGPHDRFDPERSHVFGATVRKVMRAKNKEVVVWGKGTEQRDWVYVSDIVDFYNLVVGKKQKDNFELYNVGSGTSYSVAYLVKMMVGASGEDLTILYDETKPTLNTKIAIDITKVKDAIGWEPKTFLGEGIEKTLKWYRENYV